MEQDNSITYRVLKAEGYNIVDSHYFGKNGVLLIPLPKPPKNLDYPMLEDTIYKLEIIAPEDRQGEVIETEEELRSL